MNGISIDIAISSSSSSSSSSTLRAQCQGNDEVLIVCYAEVALFKVQGGVVVAAGFTSRAQQHHFTHSPLPPQLYTEVEP